VLKVNVTREEVRAYKRTNLQVGPDQEFRWEAKFSETQMEDLKKKLGKQKENGKDYMSNLYREVFERIKPILPKLDKFKPEMVSNYVDVVVSCSEEVHKILELDKVTVKQKGLKESLSKKRNGK